MTLKNNHNKFQRDVFIDTLFSYAKNNKKILLLSNDQGAIALDNFRKKIPEQYINVGISEQNIIGVAAGLAKEGFNCFVYSIASFIIYRAVEQIKIDLSNMKLPVKIFGVGSGYSYAVDGPTHHATEDIGILNLMPNMQIYSPSDNTVTEKIVKNLINTKLPAYVRLDREMCDSIYHNCSINFAKGFTEIIKGRKNCIISSGKMLSTALSVAKELKKSKLGVVDLYKIKPFPESIVEIIKKYKTLFCLEEHNEFGGLGSIVLDFVNKKKLKINVIKLSLKQKSIFGYGSREMLHKNNFISKNQIKKIILREIL